MKKDYLTSQKLCLDDTDSDLREEILTYNKSQIHENRFSGSCNFTKNEENKRNQEITEVKPI